MTDKKTGRPISKKAAKILDGSTPLDTLTKKELLSFAASLVSQSQGKKRA